MHRPHITLACVVHCKGKFLFVEEFEHGNLTLNQPAGHLETDETLLEAAKRELFEETGIHADMQGLIKIYQWSAPRSKTDFLRFTFVVELDDWYPIQPQDPEITRGLWLSLEEFYHYIQQAGQCERSPLVIESVKDYLKGEFISLNTLKVFR
ncbi:NUDIX hydrolase [Pasteurella canis]|uniref:Phosphatase NudJ n=1 Tax=Pasteurella canis TaxID=753 RepID=A0ABQ4VFZ2_9PAST|nr:NUDIX hydrolase [Pasteurella canis]MXN89500.1 NUDIX domain-containing protein [Pasteurella canis]UAY77502.1 NUDIX hydrolase [Pasteurella canis]UDW83522.1 NUDIX hydrolase [Pasteurella canis]UEA16591.1 NUDIX hydrolase [Pasteurella canis]UEC23030.1 NUDIX hydrolase [Pasteurella canis]